MCIRDSYNTDPFAVYGSLLQGWDGLSGSWAQVSNLIYSSGIDGRLPHADRV